MQNRWIMLGYLFFINLIIIGAIANISSLMPRIAKDLDLSYSQIGSIWGAIAFGTLLFSMIGGIAGDRFGIKKVISIAIFFCTIFFALRGFAFNYATIWLCMFFTGVSHGFIVPNLFKTVAVSFGPEELGRANGIVLFGTFIGMALGMITSAPLLTQLNSWQNVFWAHAGLAVIIWLMWTILAKESTSANISGEKNAEKPVELKKIFSIKDIWFLSFAEMFTYGSFMAIIGFMPIYFVKKGMSEVEAGVITSIALWTMIIGLLVSPFLSDRIGLRKIFLWPFIIMFCAMVPLLTFTWGWHLYLIWGLAGFASGAAAPQMRSITAELPEINHERAGTAYGIVFTFNRIGGFAIPWITGLIMTYTGDDNMGFYFSSIICLVSLFFILLVRETGHRRQGSLQPETK